MLMRCVSQGSHTGPVDPANPPPLTVRVTHVNNCDHLDNIVCNPNGDLSFALI